LFSIPERLAYDDGVSRLARVLCINIGATSVEQQQFLAHFLYQRPKLTTTFNLDI